MDHVLSRCTVSCAIPEASFFFPLLWFSPVHSLSLSLFSRSLPIWRSPFSPDLEAVGLESNVASGSRVGGRRHARQSGSCLASLSLHYDVKRGDGGGVTEATRQRGVALPARGDEGGGVGAPPLLLA
jgi:hypothetical protein